MNKKEMKCYSTDASRLVGKVKKVIFPKNVKEVQSVFSNNKIDIVPRGAGTGLVGGAVPNNSIVVDMRKINEVKNFSSSNQTVKVGAGITLNELNDRLSQVGFEFPIKPFNRGISTIGGMIATNASGDKSMRYGLMKDWVQEIKFVNGRGEIRKVSKSDLMDVCSMEGTTGIIVSATLKIKPKIIRTASVFQSNSLDEALSVARRLKLEKEVVMLEFFPPRISDLLGLPAKYHVIIEFDSDRGKIKGDKYEAICKVKEKIYPSLYELGYYNSEDPKFFFDNIKRFVIYLETNDIPYFGCLGRGVIRPFFKDNESHKRKETINLANKMRTKPYDYGVGSLRKYLVKSDEKILQRVKLRHDPFGKLNKEKVVQAKTKVESNPYKGKEPAKERKGEEPKKKELDEETKKRIRDYAYTFDSELAKDRIKKVESFAKKVPRESLKKPISGKQEKQMPEKRTVRDVLGNNYLGKQEEKKEGSLGKKDMKKEEVRKEGGEVKSNEEKRKDVLGDYDVPGKKESKRNEDFIKNIMTNAYKEDNKNKESNSKPEEEKNDN